MAGPAHASNGDVVSIGLGIHQDSSPELADVDSDPSDGSHWAVGAHGGAERHHQIYHVAANGDLLGTFSNPHPAGAIPSNDLTLNRGIAVHVAFARIYVLSNVGDRDNRRYEVRVITRDGAEFVPGMFPLAPEESQRDLRGLTYNSLENNFLSRDARNGEIVKISLGGDVTTWFTIPGDSNEQAVIRGSGLTFDNEVQRLYVTWGDILSPGPTKIIEMSPDGELIDGTQYGRRTGIEIPLRNVPYTDIRGIAAYREVVQVDPVVVERRMLVLAQGCLLYHLEQTVGEVVPPTQLHCNLDASNHVLLSWQNNGSEENSAYSGTLTIIRNGIALAKLGGQLDSFTDSLPVRGPSTYEVRASNAEGVPSDTSCACEIFVGFGGLIDWAVAPGDSIFGVTENAESGDIYVSDPSGGNIFRLGPDLEPNDPDPFPSPWPNPGGIAYIPSMQFGFPPMDFTNLLAIANTSDNRVRIVDLDNAERDYITTISLQFPSDNGEPSPEIGGMTFIPGATSLVQRLVVVEKNSEQVFFFRPNGTLVHTCSPSSVFFERLDFECGISYEPTKETLLATMFDGGDTSIRETFTDGPPGQCPLASDFSISLESLGPEHGVVGFVGGIQHSANSILVTVPGLGVITRLLTTVANRHNFIRGDSTRDNAVNLSDPIFTLAYLFQNGEDLSCRDAADANDDGAVTISDAVYSLYALFVPGSDPFPAPFPEEGQDPSSDTIGCATPVETP
jgi:hypothetical protein